MTNKQTVTLVLNVLDDNGDVVLNSKGDFATETITNIMRLNYCEKIPENHTGIVEDWDGSIEYYLNGKLHREVGPAVINSDGTIEYYLNGKRHRENGPAIIWGDGVKDWYINDNDITVEVEEWIEENNIPEDWDDVHKSLFKSRFVYTS